MTTPWDRLLRLLGPERETRLVARESELARREGELARREAEIAAREAGLDEPRPVVLVDAPEEAQAPAVAHELITIVDRLVDVTPESLADPAHGAAMLRWLTGQLRGLLNAVEVVRMDETGPVDPKRHEVVDTRPAPQETLVDHVAEVVRPGYTWRGDLLRAQQVIAYVPAPRS
jgi:molecular chaperone GrpE (heat shock protein)